MLNVKNLRQRLLVMASLSITGAALADDTDIYTSATAGEGATVDGMIMLIMESRPNTGSTLCNDAASSSCLTTLGDEVYAKLTAPIADGGLGVGSGKVYLSDALRAVYLVLLPELANSGNNLHIGLMNNHANDSNCGAGPDEISNNCSKGAYILRGLEPISNAASLDELLTIIQAFPREIGGNAAHPYQAKAIYQEYYRYLTGGEVWNGALGFNDFASTTSDLNLGEDGNKDVITWDGSAFKDPILHTLEPDTGVLSNAGNSEVTRKIEDSNVAYVSPFANDAHDFACTKVYAFNNTVGTYDPDDSSDATLAAEVGGLGSGNKLKFPDVVARFHNLDMASADRGVALDGMQNVISYFLMPSPKKQDHDLAVLGGTGGAFDTSNPKQLLEDLRKAFNDIATRSSTLVAASVPVNVFNRSDIVNNVFLAIFEVNDDGYPFWPGNLKKLKLEKEFDATTGKTTLKIVAANGVAGFNPLDGRISTSATSFWTDTTDMPTAIADRSELSGHDGRSVTMGGAGQNIPGYAADGSSSPGADNSGVRKLYFEPASVTNTSASGTAVVGLAADDTAKSSAEMQSLVLAEGSTDTERETNTLNRLRWLRGMDPLGLWGTSGIGLDGDSNVDQTRSYIHLDTNDDDTKDEWRRWILGDALHSLPLTINYGNRTGYDGDGADNILGTDDDNPDIRIFMGTNDGIFHQFKNTAATTGNESGAEVWGFMPRALMDNVAQLSKQAEIVPAHPYGVDGVPVAFVIDNNADGTITHTASCTTGADDCDKVYVYFGLRRGGKAYYALDVSNPDNPPKVLWRIRKPELVTGASGTYTASTKVFVPGFNLEPGLFNEGTLTIDGTDYTVRHNTATEVVLAAGPASDATGVSFTLTSPGESDFAEMGMTFSTPRTGWVKYNDTPTPVLIFAGGYHGGWNADGTRKGKDDLAHLGSDPEGAAIFIVHARTGELIWKAVASGTDSNQVHVQALLTDSIPSEVATLDSNGNTIIDRLYVGDSGGTVWRIDLPEYPKQPEDGTPTTSCGESDQRRCWFTSQFATLGDTAGDGGTDDRRFFHAPRIVQAVDENSPSKYDAVVIGSGDRAHPKRDIHNDTTNYVENYFFALKDRKIVSGDADVKTRDPLEVGDLKDITDDCFATTCSDTVLTNGWKLHLEANGEKNLSSPLVVAGNVFFTTYLPEGGDPGNVCAPQVGSSQLYIVSFREGKPVFNLSGTITDSGLGKTDRYKDDVEGIGGDVISLGPKFIMTPGGQVFESGSEGRSTTYWRDKGQDRIKH